MTSPTAHARLSVERVVEVSRGLRGSTPAPRGAPFYGLDIDLDFSPSVLESLGDPGIFRKYERVLLLGDPKGGVARWLSERLACRIVVVDADADALSFGNRLNERAHARDRVVFVRGASARLPVLPRAFTHVWCLARPGAAVDLGFSRLIDTVRPGGHLAVQWTGIEEQGERAATVEACRAAGFEAVHVVEIVADEVPTSFRLARDRARIGGQDEDRAAGHGWRTEHTRSLTLSQLHARRPS